jgi:hypothetical protein
MRRHRTSGFVSCALPAAAAQAIRSIRVGWVVDRQNRAISRESATVRNTETGVKGQGHVKETRR